MTATWHSEQRPRIGVFLCHCGNNIGGVVAVPELTDYAASLEDVVYAEHGKFICASDYQGRIKEAIARHGLNRIVVAACTPRTHAYLFKRTIAEAGLNKYLFEFANIREHCTWVHREQREAAAEKARDLLAMAVARTRFLAPFHDVELPVGRRVLVIGGGIAGMTAALTLAGLGFEVRLVERDHQLGGLLRRLSLLYPFDVAAADLLAQREQEVAAHPHIDVSLGTAVEGVSGYLGNFDVQLSSARGSESLGVSTILVATGLREMDRAPHDPRLITQLQLEDLLRQGALPPVKSVVMINCVGSREDEGHTYCCRIGCGVALKNAKQVKLRHPHAMVYILSQDLVLPGREQDYYDTALRDPDIVWVRYPREQRPTIVPAGRGLIVRAVDSLLGRTIQLPADMVVQTVALEGDQGNEALSKILRVPLGAGKFFQEAHIKLRPLEFMTDGIYLCGGAQGPKPIVEVVREAAGAAMKAAIPMTRGVFVAESINAVVDRARCNGCGQCVPVCPYGAIKPVTKGVEVVAALCWGCGACAPACARRAITMLHYTDQQIVAQIEEALRDRPHEKILAFLCNWCSYVAADLAGMNRAQYSAALRIIRVMCSGRVAPEHIYEAFSRGAGIVLVAGCPPGDCHYMSGNLHCAERVGRISRKLSALGVAPERLRLEWLASTDGARLAEVVNELAEQLQRQGRPPEPSPLLRQLVSHAGRRAPVPAATVG